jgi:PAS domain S-box-containing protein
MTEPLDSSFETVEHGICVFDGQDRVVAWNNAFDALAMPRTVRLRPGMALAELADAMPWAQLRQQHPCNARLRGKYELDENPPTDGSMGWRASVDPVRADGRDVRIGSFGRPDEGWALILTDVSAHKRLEGHLRESEQRLRDFAESSSDWFWEMGPDLRFTYMSERVQELAGMPTAWHIGKTRAEVGGANSDPESWRAHQAALMGREAFRDFEFWRKRPDGSIQWIATSGKPRFDATGSFLGYRGTGRDITAKKLAEEQQRFLAAIVESSDDAIIGKTLDGHITSWNPAAERIYGYSAAEMIGRSIEVIVPDDRRVELWSIHERLRRGEHVPPFETVRVTRDRRRIGIALTISPITGVGGFVVGASSIGRDTTQRQQAEAALRDREAKFRAVIDTAADGIIIIDTKGTIQIFNPAAERIFGYRPDEVIGRKIEILMPPPHAKRHGQCLERARRFSEREALVVGREVEGLRKDGGKLLLELSVGEARQDGTRVFVGIVRDISERKRADRERQRALDELARSNQDLEQFAHVVSHDLQEPLRMVSSYCELLRRAYRGRLDDDADRFMDFAVDGAQRMQLLIQDLLAYARVGSRGGAFKKAEVDRSLELALVNLQEAIAESQARISVDPLPVVFADEVQLAQLLQNLISNAIKYRRDEPPEIHISVEPRGAFWAFAVTDKGIGIEPRFARSIFEVFKRLHSRTEFPGTGIGLAICKRIVERHGGEIWLDCEYGDGARFHFTLPQFGDQN